MTVNENRATKDSSSTTVAAAQDEQGGRDARAPSIALRGPFPSLERFRAGVKRPPVTFPANEVLGWTDTAALPLLPGEASAEVFAQLLKGESFDIWEPDRGAYYAWADPNWFRNPDTLPCHFPRIAFRDVSRATDSRAMRVALLPPKCFATHKGLYFLWPRGDEKDQAFLLGVLSSIPLDWYARRFVETSLSYHVLNPFPIPRPSRDNALWQRTVALAGRLACPDKRFAKWAKAVGVECGPLEAAEKDDMIHELDAVVAHLYGLSEAQLRHIFETFHEGWDYRPRLEAVLEQFAYWASRL